MFATHGQRALDEWCVRHSEAAAAARLKEVGLETTQQSVNRWRRGQTRPDEDKWPALREAFGIPVHDWLTDAVRDAVAAEKAA